MTVSYAYSQPDRVSVEAAAKVREAAERLGYPGPHPGARSLRHGRAGSLGVVLGERLSYAFDDPQAARFLAGVSDVCAAEGMGLTLVPINGSPTDVQRVAQAAVDGFAVGFRDAWTGAGHPAAGLRLAVCPTIHITEGERFSLELPRGDDPPDAIAAMSDELALGALRAAGALGLRVPADLVVTGWDDSDTAAPAGLTTVAQSLRDQGAHCARVALGRATVTSSRHEWQIVPRTIPADPVRARRLIDRLQGKGTGTATTKSPIV
ncbi:substrate-binding domain-containing protein [Actinoplanes utahensis]|uniref:substrate-binding domain-containing protein n=1 Tax=Actinoplanes utahensis TaxID=1869 RepID=UPI00068B87E3|nr:substrate-binding domain-containing protein [Actinoplanes utahensis]GIF32218.1 hypothetical protein Aut01nite_52040 [Actinoplanes utahensis]